MPGLIILPIKEANLLRARLRHLISLRGGFLTGESEKAIHDFRVASRRFREALDYLEPLLPPKWHKRSRNLGNEITQTFGPAREAQVSILLLNSWHSENRISPVAAEFLIHLERKRFAKYSRQAGKIISRKSFEIHDKLLVRLKGSRAMPSIGSGILPRRKEEFLSFQWGGNLDDPGLHDLRIRTKKFRYALEIYDRLHQRNLGRFLLRLKGLQQVLGQIHDLYILGEVVRAQQTEWQNSGLQLIPSELQKSYLMIADEKARLSVRVYPLYSRIVMNLPQDLALSWQAPAPAPEPASQVS